MVIPVLVFAGITYVLPNSCDEIFSVFSILALFHNSIQPGPRAHRSLLQSFIFGMTVTD